MSIIAAKSVIQRRQPDADLAPLVEAFASRSANVARASFPVFPTARAELIFHFADPFLVGEEEAMRPLPIAALLGPRNSVYRQSAGPRIEWFLVQLTPEGLRRLLGLPFAEAWDREFALADLWGGVATTLWELLRAAGTFDERVSLASTALREMCKDRSAGDTIVSAAGSLARAGRLRSIEQLGARLDIGPRRLRQRFTTEYGIGPKLFLSLMRFGRQLQSRHPVLAAAQLNNEPEYADDSHAIREFRQFTGMTPGAYTRLKSIGDHLVFTGRQTILEGEGPFL